MNKTILIVDDDRLQQRLLEDILHAVGYRTIIASDGEEAVTMAKDQKPDLILMDIMMPKMDGYSAVTELKRAPETEDIPVVMVTAVGYELNKDLARQVGATDYITKPFDIKYLIFRMDQILTGGASNG